MAAPPLRRLLYGWTADADAPDMNGRVVVVTGASSGLGREAALRLARRSATVVMGVRSLADGERAAESIRHEARGAKLLVWHLDVASFVSVEAFAARVDASFPAGLHVLINNAGVLNPRGAAPITDDGIETTRATDFFGPALLTHLLLPALSRGAPSRVVNVSSLGEAVGRLDWDDLSGVRRGAPNSFRSYACSKLMLLVWSQELQRRLAGTAIDVFATHPGVVHTPGEWKTAAWRPSSWGAWASALVHGQTVGWGATSILYAATEPLLASRGGIYLGPRYVQLFGYAGSNTAVRAPANPAAHDPAAGARLFDETTALLLRVRARMRRGGPLPSPDALAAGAASGAGPLGAAGAKAPNGAAFGATAPAGPADGDGDSGGGDEAAGAAGGNDFASVAALVAGVAELEAGLLGDGGPAAPLAAGVAADEELAGAEEEEMDDEEVVRGALGAAAAALDALEEAADGGDYVAASVLGGL